MLWRLEKIMRGVLTHLMLKQLAILYHAHYHEGLDLLGKCFGAQTTGTAEDGAPDVVWSFTTDFHIAFEAKSEKKAEGTLSKRNLQEAKGHRDWVAARLGQNDAQAEITILVAAPSPGLHQVALPFAKDLYYSSPGNIRKLAEEVPEHLRALRLDPSSLRMTCSEGFSAAC